MWQNERNTCAYCGVANPRNLEEKELMISGIIRRFCAALSTVRASRNWEFEHGKV